MKRRTEKILVDSVCTALLLGCVIFLLARWGSIPQQVPAHYNAAGEVDRWGGKWEMLILPGLAALLTGGLTLLEHFPAVWNPGAAVSKENRERVYAVLGRMLRTEKLILNVALVAITINSALTRPLPGWFTPGFLATVFGTLAVFLFRLYRVK